MVQERAQRRATWNFTNRTLRCNNQEVHHGASEVNGWTERQHQQQQPKKATDVVKEITRTWI
jgi:hypothetical protein